MCHLLLTVHKKKPSPAEKATKENSLDGMIRHLKSALRDLVDVDALLRAGADLGRVAPPTVRRVGGRAPGP